MWPPDVQLAVRLCGHVPLRPSVRTQMTQSTAKHIPFAIHHETQGELTNRRTMSAATEQGNFFKICNSMYMRCTENSDVY